MMGQKGYLLHFDRPINHNKYLISPNHSPTLPKPQVFCNEIKSLFMGIPHFVRYPDRVFKNTLKPMASYIVFRTAGPHVKKGPRLQRASCNDLSMGVLSVKNYRRNLVSLNLNWLTLLLYVTDGHCGHGTEKGLTIGPLSKPVSFGKLSHIPTGVHTLHNSHFFLYVRGSFSR